MSCIIDGDKVLTTPIKTILLMLKQQLDAMGIHKLKDMTFKSSDAILTCPHHKNGQENKPSCYVSLTDKGKLPAGSVHCFTCDYRANIVKFVADCLEVSYRSATEWLLGFCDYDIMGSVRELPELFAEETDVKNNYDTLPIITTSELRQYDYIHPYMFQRKLTMEVIQKFEVGYDMQTDSLTFPVYVDGRCLFVAKRRVKWKQFLMPSIEPKPIYGLDYLTDNVVIVCESVINALTCWSYGKQAIALFGTGSDYQIQKLKELPQREIILALDPDTAGKRGTYKIRKALQNCKIVRHYDIPEGKDINDLTEEEFKNLAELF